MSFIDYPTMIRDFVIDFVSLYLFAYVVIYKQFRNVELFVTVSLFNIFLLLIVMAIVRTNFNIAVGFGLFALLSLVQLRSAQFTKTETGFLFGCVVLAVINGAGITDVSFVFLSNLIVVITAWIFSAWALEHSANIIPKDGTRKVSITLKHIDKKVLGDKKRMNKKLTDLLGVEVSSFSIKKIDYVKDTLCLNALYQAKSGISHHLENIDAEIDEAEREEQTAKADTIL